MDLNNIMQMFAEPGQRQLTIASSAAILGAVQRLWGICVDIPGAYREASEPFIPFYIGANLKNLDELITKIGSVRKIRMSKLLTFISLMGPVALGLEQAIKNDSFLKDSYVFEGGCDVASAVGGYYVGRMIVNGMEYIWSEIFNSGAY